MWRGRSSQLSRVQNPLLTVHRSIVLGQREVGHEWTRARPRFACPVRASPAPQSVRVAARSSRAGSGTTSCCGHDGSPPLRLLPALWDRRATERHPASRPKGLPTRSRRVQDREPRTAGVQRRSLHIRFATRSAHRLRATSPSRSDRGVLDGLSRPPRQYRRSVDWLKTMALRAGVRGQGVVARGLRETWTGTARAETPPGAPNRDSPGAPHPQVRLRERRPDRHTHYPPGMHAKRAWRLIVAK